MPASHVYRMCVCSVVSVLSDSLGPPWTVVHLARILECFPALLQGTFLTQGSNPGLLSLLRLLLCRQIFFYWWSPREAPIYLHLYWNAQIKKKKILPFCSSLLIIFKSHYCHPLLLSSSLSISSNVTLKTPLDAWCCDRRYTKELFSWVGWPCPNFQLSQLSQDGLLCYVSQAGCSETELVSCRGC